MKQYTITAIPAEGQNKGVAREWALCNHYMIPRTKHDHTPYHKGSDLDVADKHISVKASGFSLMAGSLCEGRETFDGIWALYEERVHSNVFVYVTADYTVFEMNIVEFKQFVYMFCGLERESKRNGGKVKIKARKESKKMLTWLMAQVTA